MTISGPDPVYCAAENKISVGAPPPQELRIDATGWLILTAPLIDLSPGFQVEVGGILQMGDDLAAPP
jgi:hypothetical protein